MDVSRRLLMSGSLALTVVPGRVSGQNGYPRRPITIVAAFPAGSVTDGMARAVAESLARALHGNVLVENKPGQEGGIAGRSAARADPDGYTILIGGNSTHSAAASLYKSLPYNPLTDFVSLGGVSKIPLILVVRRDCPAEDLAGFISRAKASNPPLSSGSGATSTRVAGELLKRQGGFELVNVPYRGIPTAISDLLGGRIDCAFSDPATVLGMLEEGSIKALAVTSLARNATMPKVQTVAEQGFPDFEIVPWLALFAPAATPTSIVERLRSALAAVQQDDAVRRYILSVGSEVFSVDAGAVDQYLRADMARWAHAVEIAGIPRN